MHGSGSITPTSHCKDEYYFGEQVFEILVLDIRFQIQLAIVDESLKWLTRLY